MATKRVFNPSDSPVVIDVEGHVLGGGEWADVEATDDVIKALVAQERLLFPADSKPTTAKTKE